MREIGFQILSLKSRMCNAIQKRKQSLRNETVQNFYFIDDVSRATAISKKETMTKHSDKKQKWYLLDVMKNLHKTLLEGGGTCSYSSVEN